jgi:hypothetical protein
MSAPKFEFVSAGLVREVELVNDWKGHTRRCEASLSQGKSDAAVLLVDWGIAGQYEVSLSNGRLKGSRRVRMWRMKRTDLAAFRKACGWRKRVQKVQPDSADPREPAPGAGA